MEPDPRYEQKYTEILKSIVLRHLEGTNSSVYLFGSRAEGEIRWGSDFDIAIRGLPPDEFLAKKYAILEEVEESLVPWKVDIVNFDTADESFRRIAEKNTVPWKEPAP